jgi:hypothetical protein
MEIKWKSNTSRDCGILEINSVGEGIVWQPVQEGLKDWNTSDAWFKVKGSMHSVSKVKTLAPVDVEAINSINEFVETYVSENRLKQGIDKLTEMGLDISVKNLGEFIRWVFNDIMKEEADTVVANQINPKTLGGPIATKARKWFMANYC